MIENVEDFGPELHVEALRDCCCLINREVPLFEGWAMQRVAALIPVVPRSDRTVRCKSQGRAAHGTRDCEGTEIEIIERIARMVLDRSNNIGPVEAIPTAAVVIFEVVVKLEGLAIL